MRDPDATGHNHIDEPGGATVELSLSDPRNEASRSLAAPLDDQLPGIEPERKVTDWGRSERVEGLVDRTVYDFLYRYWFRVDVEDVLNVPADGGALLVANRAGAVPADGAMIGKAIREEHPRARPVHVITNRQFSNLPGVGMIVTKLGGVAAHPANLQRLLFDERQLVLLFPEGQAGARKPLSERYRLRAFQSGAFVRAAMRARVPIVPVAVIGAEEAGPVFAGMNPLRRLTRLPRIPLAGAAPLPAKFKIRFLEPVATDEFERSDWRDDALVQSLGEDVRALLQENVFEMVAQRRSVWLG